MSLTWFQDAAMARRGFTLMRMAANDTAATCCTLQEGKSVGI